MFWKQIKKNKKIVLLLGLILAGCFWWSNFSLAESMNSLEGFEKSGWIGSVFFSGVLMVLYGILKIVLLLLAGSMWLLDVMISPEIFDAVFFSPEARAGINTGWEFVRDFFNLFFILILVLVGLSTILGVSNFKDKTAIIRVAFAAMLINFSKPITLFFIDMSQVFMRFFAESISGMEFAAKLQKLISFEKIIGFNSLEDDFVYFVAIIMAIIMVIIISVMLFYLAISLIIRMIAFWVLIILSPVAMFGIAMEGTKLGRLKDDWTQNLMSWCFYGPILLFFIWLSIILVTAITGATESGLSTVHSIAPEQLQTEAGGLSGFIVSLCGILIPYITVIYLLFYGYDKAKSVSTGAASKILQAGSNKISQINSAAKKRAYGGSYILPKTRKGIKEGVQNRIDNAPILGRFTQKGKQDAQAKISAKWKNRIGGDKGEAENKYYEDKAREITTKWKDNPPTTKKLTEMFNGDKKEDKIAATLYKAQNNKIGIDENGKNEYEVAMKNLTGYEGLREKITQETKKENLGAVIDYEIKQKTEEREKDENGNELTKEQIKKKVFDKNLNGNLNTIFKNQNKNFYEQEGVVDYLYQKHQNKNINTRRKFAENIKNSEVEEKLMGSEKGGFLMGVNNERD